MARSWAVRLARRGHHVSVITTCALDHHTWRNELPAGPTVVDGLPVSRFPISVTPDIELLGRLFRSVGHLPINRQDEMLHNTGFSEGLLQEIANRAESVDVFIFAPYLYPSTVFGSMIAPDKSLVMPTLHDEERATLSLLIAPLHRVAGVLFLSQSEADVAQRLVGSMRASQVVGTGIEVPPPGDSADFMRENRIRSPYLVYAGRREGLKNFPLLLEWTAAQRAWSNGSGAELCAIGSGPAPFHKRPWLHLMDSVSVEVRQTVMSAATAVVNLSLNESFSLVLMEAWLAGAPVIVHADSPVTRHHCESSGGGLWVRSAEEFCEAINLLASDDELRAQLAQRGREYVLREYSWDVVLPRIESAIAECLA